MGLIVVVGVKELKQLVADNAIFQSFDDEQLRELLGLVSATREIPEGECLVREGDEAEEVFIIERGRFAVLKQDPKSSSAHQIGEVRPGMSVGEVALLDRGRRSATLQAIDDTSVLVIPIDRLERTQQEHLPIGAQMKIALADQMGGRFRNMAGTTVEMLQAKLDEEEKRAEMGRFVSRVLFGTCLYMYALGALQALTGYVADTTMVTIPILVLFAIGLYINVKTSIYPASAYGFTLENWRPAVKEAILFSLPVAVLIVVVKWILVETYPPMQGQRVFDFYQSKGVGLV
ncbi:MAG: cyclic nucleotide-binding domain-containing protein, partial [Pseudomonadota bacterium]